MPNSINYLPKANFDAIWQLQLKVVEIEKQVKITKIDY
jgi:hypothetical protein